MAAVCSPTVEVGADGDVTSLCKYLLQQAAKDTQSHLENRVILMLVFGVVMYLQCTPVKLNKTIFEIYNFTKTLFQVPTNCPALFRNVK